jgi:hypothetical protein
MSVCHTSPLLCHDCSCSRLGSRTKLGPRRVRLLRAATRLRLSRVDDEEALCWLERNHTMHTPRGQCDSGCKIAANHGHVRRIT